LTSLFQSAKFSGQKPSFGCRGILGMSSNGWMTCQCQQGIAGGSTETLQNRRTSDSDNHPKLAKGKVMLKVRCYVARALWPLFFPSSLVSWLRRPNLDACVHLTRRPSLTLSQIYQCAGTTVSRCIQRTRRFSGGRVSR
jgi:hypothetical protein